MPKSGSEKQIKILVKALETELEFSISPSTNGHQLLYEISQVLGLHERCFFALQCADTRNKQSWIKLNQAKYYYEDVKDNILNGLWECPLENALLLASFAIIEKYGPYNEAKNFNEILIKENYFLPKSFEGYHAIISEEWQSKILQLFQDHSNIDSDQARIEYLKAAQDLPSFGMSYYQIKNKRGSTVYLGIDAVGISVFEMHDKLQQTLIFFTQTVKKSNEILLLCMGYHELYMRKRRETTNEPEDEFTAVETCLPKTPEHKEECDRDSEKSIEECNQSVTSDEERVDSQQKDVEEEYCNNSSVEISEKSEKNIKENNEPTPYDIEGKEKTEETEDNKSSIDAKDYTVVMRPKKPKTSFVPTPDEYINEDVSTCLCGMVFLIVEAQLETNSNAPRPEEEKNPFVDEHRVVYKKLIQLFEELSKKPDSIETWSAVNKYKTLKEIRRGYTKERIAIFEGM
ncbi:DgyrCDS953 [Dimorphilus gyrociliatus]|uniref:DgyrCDS953 n=1 Tax=Dimorphilus gyrociliatus TaxID=2664684 RepID=A0A7I8V7X2_9ANNE|nr:DgyrCDS953 [Dimorphilus gyrociliatus]